MTELAKRRNQQKRVVIKVWIQEFHCHFEMIGKLS
jgi:hypothetical protein